MTTFKSECEFCERENLSDSRIYYGELEVDENKSVEQVIDFVADYLRENGHENSPLVNKLIRTFAATTNKFEDAIKRIESKFIGIEIEDLTQLEKNILSVIHRLKD